MSVKDDQQDAAIAQLAQQVQAGGARLTELENRFGAGERRITQLETRYADDLARIEPVLTRVEELSSAAVAFNGRLNAAEGAIVVLQAASGGAVDLQRLTDLEVRVTALSERLEQAERVRTRGSGLSDRLAQIEADLANVKNPPTEGPT